MQALSSVMDPARVISHVPDRSLDRYRGALLGLAIGDALGMPVEFLHSEEIKRRYGRVTRFETPFVDHPNTDLEAGQYTDDTQIFLLLAQRLVDCHGFVKEDFREKLRASESNFRGLG